MKWLVVIISFTLLCYGNGGQEKKGNLAIEELRKIGSFEMIDSNTQRLLSLEVAPSIISAADSAFITEKLTELNAKYYLEWCEGREQVCDSFGGWFFEDADVLYSADSTLKVFSFMGEYIGAYGSPMYHSVYLVDNVYTIDTTFLTARQIIRFDNNQFLILADGPIRMRGSEWSYFKEAYLFDSGKVSRVCQSQLSHWIENSNGNRAFYPNIADEIDSLEKRIVYIPNKKILKCTTFGYNENEYTYGEFLPCYKATSTYQFTGGQFRLVKSDSTFDIRVFR